MRADKILQTREEVDEAPQTRPDFSEQTAVWLSTGKDHHTLNPLLLLHSIQNTPILRRVLDNGISSINLPAFAIFECGEFVFQRC